MILTSKRTVRPAQVQDETLQLAQRELLAFLKQSPGMEASERGEVEIAFDLVSSAGYSVTARGNTLRFAGPSPVEVLYAVYTFAEERLGFCFFEPGRDRVTKQDRVVLEEGTVISERTPLLPTRGLVQEYPADESNYRLADWMARNRLNYLLTWMKYYEQFSDDMKRYYRVRGITVESGHHSFDYYIPLREYYREHPEYFAIVNGKRVQPEAGDAALLMSKQLCVTNPALRAEFAKRMIAYARAHPELRVITIIPNDGFGWCECETCSTFYDKSVRGDLYSVSEHVYKAQDLYHDFVKDVCARVHKELPDITITLAAYVNYVDPAEGFTLGKGMAVHAAPYWHCINHALHDPACPINRRYMESLARWGAVKKGGALNIYEYYMGVNFYLSLPMIHHEVVFDELRALRHIGADGILTQYHLPHWTAYGLNFYMMAKAAYGEDVSVVKKCMRDLFGPDAEEAEGFYRELRSLVLSAGPCHIPIPRPLLRRTRMEQYERLRARAQALLGKSPDDRLRRNLVVWMDYLIRWKRLFDDYQSGKDVRADLRAFEQWCAAQSAHDICVPSRLAMYLGRWIEQIEKGKPWYHFNIDWEDEYVKRYDTLLNAVE